MAEQPILLLGNPILRMPCSPVRRFDDGSLRSLVDDLRDTLSGFRARMGFGRGISAPQIGISRRVVYVDTGDARVLINPVIVRRSRKRILLWDDCFSFPHLAVKVKRHLTVHVRYRDLQGRLKTLRAEGGLSELLQHEIDHCNGILALDRAIDVRHIVYRSELQTREPGSTPVAL